MATFQGDSTDDEIGVNLQLAERLSINRGDHASASNRILSKKDQKQLCNQRKKKLYRDEQSSSSSSLEMQNDQSTSRMTNVYGLHNKKRQSGDKNIEPLANPKRTCLSDRFGGSPERKNHKSKTTNGDVKHLSTRANLSPQPLNLSKRNIFPDNTYEDHLKKFSDGDDSDFEPWRPFTRKKKNDDGELSRAKRQGASNSSVQLVQENQASTRHGVQFIDSTSDDDSFIVTQNGALKGGRQSPDPMSFKKVLGRNVKKVIESDDTDDDDWQVNYRRHRLVFSSSDSDDSGPSNKVTSKPIDATIKKSANLSFSSGDSFTSNHDHRYHKPDLPFYETFKVGDSFHVRASEPTTSGFSKSCITRSSKRIDGSSFVDVPPFHDFSYLPDSNAYLPQCQDSYEGPRVLNMQNDVPRVLDSIHGASSSRPPSRAPYRDFCPIPNNVRSLQDKGVHPVDGKGSSFRARGATLPKIPHHRRTHSSKSSKGRSVAGACSQKGKSNLAARYPDLFDAEDSSEVEFFTANSYSDTESNTESLTSLRRSDVLKNPPVQIQDANCDSINVGSSEDEISVVFTSVPQSIRNSDQRRGAPRTLGRRHNRGSRRHISNSQDVASNSHDRPIVSLSPDPVEQVRQIEEDERFARMLQAEFDDEAGHAFANHTAPPENESRDGRDPLRITVREISSSGDDSIDLEVFPRNSSGFLAVGHPFSIIPTVVSSRRGSFRTRRPDARNRRRWAQEDSWNLSRIFQSAPLANIFSFESSDDSYEAFLGLAELNGDVTRGLQKSEINRLPTRKYTTPNGASSSNGAELPHKRAELNKECQVCLTDYSNGDVLRILPCFHEFHTPCIDPWLKINHTCPVCRVIVDLAEYDGL